MGFMVCHIEAQPSYLHLVTDAEFVLCGAPNDMHVYIKLKSNYILYAYIITC